MNTPPTNGTARKVAAGVLVTLMTALVVGGVGVSTRQEVLQAHLRQHELRLTGVEDDLRAVGRDVADIRADIREIKAILQRLEDRANRGEPR